MSNTLIPINWLNDTAHNRTLHFLISHNLDYTLSQIAKETGYSRAGVRKALKFMLKKELVEITRPYHYRWKGAL